MRVCPKPLLQSVMNSFFLVVFSALWVSLNAAVLGVSRADSTLELVHVVFRHGDRNPDQASLWESNAYYNESFYPEGFGQLTNQGKRTEYNLGRRLRARYAAFLGPTWNINLLDVRTTDYNRTKMSVQLMLAGLFPPRSTQIWGPLLWQPIPYNYEPLYQDKELAAFYCPTFLPDVLQYSSSPKINEYIQDRYNETLEILAANTGSSMDLLTAFSYYFGLLVQDQLGFKLPEWSKAIYPEPLHSLGVDFYYLETNTTALRRVVAGYFLKKVLADTKSKIDGTLTPPGRKMFIYSAHETNVATVLLALEAFKIVDIPNYGSHVLFEVHNVNGVYGLKLFFQNYDTVNPIPIKLPGCDYFCPYDQFYGLVEELLPETDAECYGS